MPITPRTAVPAGLAPPRTPALLAVLAGLLGAASLGAAPIAAQDGCPLAPGCTLSFDQTLPFQTRGQSLWGPGDDPTILENLTFTLFDESWYETGSGSDTETLSGFWGTWRFGGSVAGHASGRLAAFFDVTEFGTAMVDVDYPVRVRVEVPAPNTYRGGDAITIRTSWEPIADGMSLDASMDPMDVMLRGTFGMTNAATYKLCLVSCSDTENFFSPMTIPETEFPIFWTVDGSFGIGDEEPTSAEGIADMLAELLTGIGGYVRTPDPFGDAHLDGTTLRMSGSDVWGLMRVDVDAWLRFLGVIPGLPFPPLGACLPLADYDAFDLCYETLDLDAGFSFHQHDAVSLDAGVRIRVDLPVAMAFAIADEDGAVTESGSGSSIAFPVGHSLVLVTPEDVTPRDLASVFSLDGTVHRATGLAVEAGMTAQALQLSLDMETQTHSGGGYKDDGGYEKRSCPDFLKDPAGNAQCELEHLWTEISKIATSRWWKWVSDWVWTSVTKTVAAIDFDWGPLAKVTVDDSEQTAPLFDRSWQLGGFETLDGPMLTLDPEDPRIVVASALANTSYLTGGHHGTLTQTVTVSNAGDVPLDALSILDGLAGAGIIPEAAASDELFLNPAFDGGTVSELLNQGQTLPVNGSASVRVRWAATPGLHALAVEAAGTSPIGTAVEHAAAERFAWFDMRIVPGKLNRRARGVTPIHLYGSAALDVSDVDPASLHLEGVTPDRVKLGDFNDDGIADLRLHVSTPAVVAALDARVGALQAVVADGGTAAPAAAGLFSAREVARALFGAGDERAVAMDRAGNRNGRLDVGDLRAAALAGGPAPGGPAPGGPVHPIGSDSHAGVTGDTRVLILTGALADGTPLWAEAAALITGENR